MKTATEISPEIRALLWTIGDALTGIIQNDKTEYKHHEPRPSDGKRPGEAKTPGSIWVTPKEIAEAVLPAIKETLGGEWV